MRKVLCLTLSIHRSSSLLKHSAPNNSKQSLYIFPKVLIFFLSHFLSAAVKTGFIWESWTVKLFVNFQNKKWSFIEAVLLWQNEILWVTITEVLYTGRGHKMCWICKRGNIYVSAVCHLYIMYLAKTYLNQETFLSHALVLLLMLGTNCTMVDYPRWKMTNRGDFCSPTSYSETDSKTAIATAFDNFLTVS